MKFLLIPLATGGGVFPTMEHDQISVGPYGLVQSLESPLDMGAIDPTQLRGIELRYRDISPADSFEEALASGYTSLIRMGVDESGTVQLDQLRLETALVSLKIRRNMGDEFDLAVIGGDTEITWKVGEKGPVFYRTFSPTNFTLLGFSNTDFDADAKLKGYISIGSGLGGEVLIRTLGHVGVMAQGAIQARSLNRHQGGAPNQIRHEVLADGELGLGYLGSSFGILLSAWGELGNQWEIRDADGKSGIDRQVATWGVRLTARWAGQGPPPEEPEVETSVDARTW